MLLLASCPAFAKAEPTLPQANPMYRIKAAGINPNAIGPDNPYYTPADIKKAYNLPSGGSGTIAIVDAYSDPNIAANLASFSSQWGLASPNFEIHQMSSLIQSNSGWGLEESLDVEWAHAVAPTAKILLVEAISASTTDLLSAVDYAAGRSDVVAISMSWGANEFSGEQSYDSNFISNYGASFFASSGDTGGVVTWPSSSANVISVGGTTLTQTSTGYTEKAWSSGGGGVSAYEQVPASQALLGYQRRATPDVSYNADPNTGFLVLDTYGYSGWYAVGGTSTGAPQWAAIQSLGLSVTSQNLYNDYAQPSTYAADFTDITSGTNTVYPATAGYDLATGLGSPLTTGFTPATGPDFSLSSSPSTLTIQAGGSPGTSTVTATSLNGYSGTLNLGLSGNAATWASITTPVSVTTATPGTSTLTVKVPSGTAGGTYAVTVTAKDTSNPPLSHSTTVTVIVANPDFSISASPRSLSIRSGSQGKSTITIGALNGFTGSVSLTASASRTGVTATLSPTSITNSGTSTLTITVPSSLRSGSFTVTVTGKSGTISHSTTITVTISRF